MMLLRLISWPYARRHLVRSGLTVVGIVLGVAVFVGMHTANEAVFFGFQQTVDRIAGATQLQVSAGEPGFPEEVLERVQALPEVKVAVPVIESAVGTKMQGEGNLLVLGIDMTGDRRLREYDLESGEEAIIDDPLVFLAQPDSIMITRDFAARNGLDVNDAVTLETAVGDKRFTVRGIMRAGGMSRAFGGNLAVMDIYAAQVVFGRGRRFDRIDLAVRDDVPVEEARMAIARALGPGFQVEQPQARAEQFESLLHVYSVVTNVSSAFALFIGMFIIYNSFAIAVTQRRSEIGILRALGATRRQVRTLFLAESAAGGLVGSIIGGGLGLMIARSIAGSISDMLQGIYGIAERTRDVSADPRILSLAIAIGIATSMVAAWIPARNAARVDPVQALQKGKYQMLTAGENRARRFASIAAAAVSALLLLWGARGPLFYAAYALGIVAALLLTPTAALVLARAVRPALKRLRPVEGALAADSLIQAPRRTSGAVSALMLSLAQVVGLGGIAVGSYRSIVEWMNTALNPDLFVTASENLADRTFSFPGTMADELKAIPGIADVQRVRTLRIAYRGTPVLIVAVDIESLQRHVRRPSTAGDDRRMYEEAAAGRGVILSDNLAQLQRIALGDVVHIDAPAGTVHLPVVGVIMDWSDQQGTIFMDRSVFVRNWADDSVNIFRVYADRGASVPDLRTRILERLGSTRRLFVLTNEDVRQYIIRLTQQWLGLTYVQVMVAVLVAVLGIVNTLTVSIIDRRRELGVLRAVGAVRRQVRHTVWLEAVSIGIIGCVLGFALGALNLYYLLEFTSTDLSGFRVGYHFPASIVGLMVPTILGAAFLSALWPAESAVRGSLVEALEYE
jgi:putative ABC transport system permease protein